MSDLKIEELAAAHKFVVEKAETYPMLADIAMESLAKHDVPKLLGEVATLRARIAALEAALQWYADPKNWDDEGAAMDNVTGGYWSVDQYVDVDYDWDKGAHARAALAASSPAPASARVVVA